MTHHEKTEKRLGHRWDQEGAGAPRLLSAITAASVARSQNSRLGMPAAPVARSFQTTLTGPQQTQTEILYKWMVCSLPEGKLASAILTDWFLGIK